MLKSAKYVDDIFLFTSKSAFGYSSSLTSFSGGQLGQLGSTEWLPSQGAQL
jgi:hypothetical protein